jgi:hypothetical protein
MLKPPGAEHLKLTCDTLLLTFAFEFKLRRYNLAVRGGRTTSRLMSMPAAANLLKAGSYTRPLRSST